MCTALIMLSAYIAAELHSLHFIAFLKEAKKERKKKRRQ